MSLTDTTTTVIGRGLVRIGRGVVGPRSGGGRVVVGRSWRQWRAGVEMPRRGERNAPKVIAGDQDDRQGFPILVEEYCESMTVRGFSPGTVYNHRGALAWLARWLCERGVSRPSEVTKPMLDGYQRSLYYRRKADGHPLSFRAQQGRLIPVRTFFRWLMRRRRVTEGRAGQLVAGAGQGEGASSTTLEWCASTVLASSVRLTSRAFATERTVDHDGSDWPSSIRARVPDVTPA